MNNRIYLFCFAGYTTCRPYSPRNRIEYQDRVLTVSRVNAYLYTCVSIGTLALRRKLLGSILYKRKFTALL